MWSRRIPMVFEINDTLATEEFFSGTHSFSVKEPTVDIKAPPDLDLKPLFKQYRT
jgi:hypothetical protein